MKYYIVENQDGTRAFRSRGQWLDDAMAQNLRDQGYVVYIEK